MSAEEDSAIVRAANAQHGDGVGGDAETGGNEAEGASSTIPVRGAQALQGGGFRYCRFKGQGAKLNLFGCGNNKDPFDRIRKDAYWMMGGDTKRVARVRV